MKIEILRENRKDALTGEVLKKGQIVEMDEARAKKAIANGNGKEVKSKPKSKKSTQDKVSKKTIKK